MNDHATFYRRHGKRLFDVFVSALALLVLAPVLLLLALLVRLCLRKPVLFRQQRSGLGGHQHVRKHHRKRLIHDDVASAPDRVSKAKRFHLTHEAHLPGPELV